MQKIDDKRYVSLSHWGLFPVDTSFMRWESDDDAHWDNAPFEMDMARGAQMLRRMKELKSCGNSID